MLARRHASAIAAATFQASAFVMVTVGMARSPLLTRRGSPQKFKEACTQKVSAALHPTTPSAAPSASHKTGEDYLGGGVDGSMKLTDCCVSRSGRAVASVEGKMAENTAISWADATFNPWIGCTKVSTGPQGACEKCYAERDNARRGWVPGWGAGIPRRRTKTWTQPCQWNAKAAVTGYRPRVFCASLADVFDNEVPQEWRNDLWELIRETPHLRWMLLTKRIGNAPKMLPDFWPMAHVGLMSTLATQPEWDRDYHKLAAIPAAWHGVSAEPLLGPINIGDAKPDWIITGGESGAGYRYTNPDWVRSLRDQCARNGVAFHHKQWGGVRPKDHGCELDGREHKDFPTALAA